MGIALAKLAEEDPTFVVRTNEQTGQTLISGMGELHLEVLVDRMKREFKVDARVGKPRVSYRETITVPSRGEGRFVRQTGGSGQYGHAVIEVEPLPDDAEDDFIVEDKTRGGSIPKEYIKPTLDGMREAAQSGVLAGFPVVRFKASIIDGSYHEVDSSEMAFKIAGSMALKDAIHRGKPILLEPYMRVEVVVPEEYAGDVIGDLSARRSEISGMETRMDGVASVKAHTPLGEMFGYATSLRNMSQGRGSFTMEFEQYRPAPQFIIDAVMKGGG